MVPGRQAQGIQRKSRLSRQRANKDVSAREHGRVFQAETDGFAQFFKRFGLERASFLKRFHVCPASVPC